MCSSPETGWSCARPAAPASVARRAPLTRCARTSGWDSSAPRAPHATTVSSSISTLAHRWGDSREQQRGQTMPRSRLHASDSRRFRFAFDIGGTFTDLVVSDGGGRRIAVGKCLTQPGEITRFVVEGLARLLEREQIPTSAIQEVVAGATTLVTNRIIERKGARTGLITTQGFGDVLEIRREMRYDIYDLT